MDTLQSHINDALNHLKNEFSKLQTGRANTALVDEIQVENYGTLMPLKQVANIACPDAKTIKIEPWDKSSVKNIEKAVLEANIGINPQNMGTYLFLPIPPMTEERRKTIVKRVNDLAENARIAIRNARHEAIKKLKKQEEEHEISEDERKRYEKEIQEKIDEANKTVAELTKNKEQEILTV